MKHLYKYLIGLMALFAQCSAQARCGPAHPEDIEPALSPIVVKVPPVLAQQSKEVEELVQRAACFLEQERIDRVCFEFAHNPEWRHPSTKLFLIDEQDAIWFILDEDLLTWEQLRKRVTLEGPLLPVEMRVQGRGGGWLSFLWNQGLVRTYVKNVDKCGRLYTVGAFLFAEDPFLQVQEQVFVADRFLNHHGLQATIGQLNAPAGQFLRGSYSVALYDDTGVCLADSYDISMVGSSARDWKDDRQRSLFAGFLACTEKTGIGWTDHTVDGLLQRIFVSRVKEPLSKDQKFYFLASGYFPQVNDAFVINMVKKAREEMEREGSVQAFKNFAKHHKRFYKARLSLVIYDEQGIVKAESKYPSVIGVNAYNRKDQAGYLVTQDILETILSQGSGWVFQYILNAAELIYGERVILPEGTFVVTVQGYTPLTKKNASAAIVEWLCRRLTMQPAVSIFKALNNGAAIWNRGFKGSGQGNIYSDLFVEIYDAQGFCLTAGSHVVKMWTKMDSSFKRNIKQLLHRKQKGDWFVDRMGFLTRFYYARVLHKSPSEIYYLFCGYKTP